MYKKVSLTHKTLKRYPASIVLLNFLTFSCLSILLTFFLALFPFISQRECVKQRKKKKKKEKKERKKEREEETEGSGFVVFIT